MTDSLVDRFPPAWRKAMHPTRGSLLATPAPPTAARTAAGEKDFGEMATVAQAIRDPSPVVAQFLAGKSDPAGLAEILAARPWASGERTRLSAGSVDWLIERFGLTFIAAATVAMAQGRTMSSAFGSGFRTSSTVLLRGEPRLTDDLFDLARRVRERLFLADDAAYDEATAVLEAAVSSSYGAVVAGFLIPTDESLVAAALPSSNRTQGASRAAFVVPLARTVDELIAVATYQTATYNYETPRYVHAIANVVENFSPAPEVALQSLLEVQWQTVPHIKAITTALAYLNTPDAVRILRDMPVTDTRRAAALTTVAARAPELLRSLLSDSAHQGDRDMVRNLVEPAPELTAADRANLPPLLANPPWENGVKRAKQRRPMTGLAEPAPRIVATDAERERATQIATQQLETRERNRIQRYHRKPELEHVLAHGDGREASVAIDAAKSDWLYRSSGFRPGILRFGDALTTILVTARESWDGDEHDLLYPIVSVAMAAHYAAALGKRSKYREAAGYFHRNAAHVASHVSYLVLTSSGTERRDAVAALRFIANELTPSELSAVATSFGAEASAAITEILAQDPLMVLPARMPELPTWLRRTALPALTLVGGGEVPVAAVDTVVTCLQLGTVGAPYAGVAELQKIIAAPSLARFGWALFEQWQAAGYPTADQWAMWTLGWVGGDDEAVGLAEAARVWPQQNASRRSEAALDVLVDFESERALMELYRISRTVKSRPLRDKAADRLQAIAANRGLSDDELADRLVPDLGLDARGAVAVDYGPRTFIVTLSSTLTPIITRDDGSVVRTLPKPGAKDDPDLAPEAERQFKRLRRDAKNIAKEQFPRFEAAMLRRRSWTASDVEELFVNHPVLRQVIDGVVFRRESGLTIRHTAEGEWIDLAEEPVELDPTERVHIPHPIDLPAAEQQAWSQHLSDYELHQPFAQFGRPVAVIDPADVAGRLAQIYAVTLPAKGFLALKSRGWEHDQEIGGGYAPGFRRQIADVTVELYLEKGVHPALLTESDRIERIETRDGVAAESAIVRSEVFASVEGALRAAGALLPG